MDAERRARIEGRKEENRRLAQERYLVALRTQPEYELRHDLGCSLSEDIKAHIRAELRRRGLDPDRTLTVEDRLNYLESRIAKLEAFERGYRSRNTPRR
jgi:hypothetical protein